MKQLLRQHRTHAIASLLVLCASVSLAQPPQASTPGPPIPKLPPGMNFPPRTPNDALVSPEVSAEGMVTFRVYAPNAKSVQLDAEFLEFGKPLPDLTPDSTGVWSLSTAPLPSGAYRYNFKVDGAVVPDNRNPNTSSTPSGVRSLVDVSTSPDDFQADRTGIPHGEISTVYYDSPVAGGQRRLHVYLPPDYLSGKDFPVLYLIHGGGDGDESWPTVGRAGFILDNLIASGKARSMVVVFPNGGVKGGQPMVADPERDPFTADLMTVILPYIQSHYKVSSAPDMRALAGLSMGGIQTLNIGLTHSGDFRYIGVFSSGWFPADLKAFDEQYGSTLKQQTSSLKLLWYGYGDTDIARTNAENVLKMFDGHGVKYQTEMTPGGHTWINWRLYLSQFAPLLFR